MRCSSVKIYSKKFVMQSGCLASTQKLGWSPSPLTSYITSMSHQCFWVSGPATKNKSKLHTDGQRSSVDQILGCLTRTLTEQLVHEPNQLYAAEHYTSLWKSHHFHFYFFHLCAKIRNWIWTSTAFSNLDHLCWSGFRFWMAFLFICLAVSKVEEQF